jgi:hypothetical protein
MILDVKLGDKVRTLRFGNYALLLYNNLTNTEAGTIKQIDEEYTNIDLVCDITFCSLQANYKVKREPFNITIQQVAEWLDEADINTISEIITAFTKSITSSSLVEQANKVMASETNAKGSKKK